MKFYAYYDNLYMNPCTVVIEATSRYMAIKKLKSDPWVKYINFVRKHNPILRHNYKPYN